MAGFLSGGDSRCEDGSPSGTTFLHGESGGRRTGDKIDARCFSRSVPANLIMLTSCGVVGSTAVYDFAYRTHPDL
jgi:hypothetical protein